MARLSPLHDAVPRVGGFLNAVVGVVEKARSRHAIFQRALGYLVCDRFID
jgi:hypothetical protein